MKTQVALKNQVKYLTAIQAKKHLIQDYELLWYPLT